jgi:hypothetical protein
MELDRILRGIVSLSGKRYIKENFPELFHFAEEIPSAVHVG